MLIYPVTDTQDLQKAKKIMNETYENDEHNLEFDFSNSSWNQYYFFIDNIHVWT